MPRQVVDDSANFDYTSKFTSDEIEEYRDAFSVFDTDNDGVITTKELGTLLRSLGQNPTEAEVTEIINVVDADKNGVLEFREFVAMMGNRITNETMERELKEAFRVFDKDGDGFISAEEFRTLMTSSGDRLTIDEVNDLIQFADIDGDGVIDYLEFVSLMMNLNFDERNERSARMISSGSDGSLGSQRANGTRTSPGREKKQPVLQRR